MKAKELRQLYSYFGFMCMNDEQLQRFAAIEPKKFDDVVNEYNRRKAARCGDIGRKVQTSKNAYEILLPYVQGLEIEHSYCIYLNKCNKVLGVRKIGEGGVDYVTMDARVIFGYALREFKTCTGIVVAHNHPSGNLRPSEADNKATQQIKAAGNYHSILLLDHVIIAQESYFSFGDEGLI